MEKAFFSDIIRNETYQNNDLKDLCEVVPATPIVTNTVINPECDFIPRYDKYYIPKKKCKLKVRTVRDIRNRFEKDALTDLSSYLERQQNILLRKIRDGCLKNDQTKLLAKNILNGEEPITRASWQMLMNINPEGHIYTSQYIRCDGKPIRINGCKGGSNKFICNLTLGREKKPLNNKIQKKSSLKKKYLLRNSLSVNFKPGPLTRKKQLDNSYQKYSVGDIELVKLPKPGLVIQPSHGRTLDPIISNLINNFRDVNGFISEKWAEFAVSVLGSKNKSEINQLNDSSLIFDLNYKYDQRKILMRKDRYNRGETSKTNDILNIKDIPETDKFNVIPEVRVMVNKILDAVEISLNQNTMFTGDDEPREHCEKDLLHCISHVKDKSKKRCCELDRLNVTVKRLPENIHNNLSACRNSFCSLGCICNSLQCALHLKDHCGRIECMFECKCDLSNYRLISDYDGQSSELLPGLNSLDKEINYKFSKKETKFHETVKLTKNQSKLLKSARRNWKSSKIYEDFYSKMSLKSNLISNPVLSVLVNKLNCENIEPWCMVHNLYKCFCKGKFTDTITTEKALNESEKYTIDLDKKSSNITCLIPDTCVNNDSNQLETSKERLIQIEKYSEKNNSVIILDKESDIEDSCSNESYQLQRSRSRKQLNHNNTRNDEIDIVTYYNSCARTKPYDGRKYSLGYYINANFKIQNMEINDGYLRKRLQYLIDKSADKQDRHLESDIMSEEKALRRSERIEHNFGEEYRRNENKSTFIDSNSSKVVENTMSTNQASHDTIDKQSDIETITTFTNKRISNKPKLVAWLESSYQQYKQRMDKGIVKNTLEPPKKGKVCLYPWDFILSRYSERKNLFLVSKSQPFRLYMAVDSKNPQFEHCINIDEIRFADLYKYPVTVKNLLTNTNGLNDNFCILFGLTHCWELIGSVMKIKDSTGSNNTDITHTLSDQSLTDLSSPFEEAFHQSTHEESVSASSSNSKEFISDIPSPDKNAISESSKWFVMTVENDFSEIQFYNKGFFVKHESIAKALNVARVSGKTVRLSSQKCADKSNSPQFGIYAIPNTSKDCVFVGPYETDECLGIETVKTVTQNRRQIKMTRGVWIITNKIDNLKVIDNPLSFMPSQDVQMHEMLPLDNIENDNNKSCNFVVHPVINVPERSVKELSNIKNQNKVVKPITIRKSDEICRISPKSLLKVANSNFSYNELMVTESESFQSSSSSTSAMTSPLITLLKKPHNTLPVIIGSDTQLEKQPSVNNHPAVVISNKSVQSSSQVYEQKLRKPVAEVAPQIKIAAVYSEALEKLTENKRPEKTMLILKPEEINKRHLNRSILQSEGSSTSFQREKNETMDIEDFLDSSTICTAPADDTLVISDEEDESPVKIIWIKCTNIDNFGLIQGHMNKEGEISFQFPGFKESEFYSKEVALAKIHQVLSRKVYVPHDLSLEWDVIDSKGQIKNFKFLTVKDFGVDIVLTKHGLRHKTQLMNSADLGVKTYASKKSRLQSSSSNISTEEFKIPEKSIEVAIRKTIKDASDADREQFTNALEHIMHENQETSLPSSELFDKLNHT